MTKEHFSTAPNNVTGANAGKERRFQIRALRAARIA
jgi:hypothetical protein